MVVDELVRTLYPPSKAEAIFRLMLERLGEVVTLEDMAAAVFVDDPGLAHYDSTQAWGDAARHLVSDIRQRLREADAPYEVDTVIRRGYRLVNRRAPSKGDKRNGNATHDRPASALRPAARR